MQDTKLFETILGITTPWHVARVELKTEDKRVDLWLEHEPDAMALSGVRRRVAGLRPCRGTHVAASRHVSVSDAPARGDSAGVGLDGPQSVSVWRSTTAYRATDGK